MKQISVWSILHHWLNRLLAVCLLLISWAQAQPSGIDQQLAQQYFGELRALAERDGGQLWQQTLEGPVIFADPSTRAVMANMADTEGNLTATEDLFTGQLPENVPIANTALDWGGRKWTMLMWPLPEDQHARAALMMHESWHRVQGDLGLPSNNVSCDHLAALEGRIWLQLEFRALSAALQATGGKRRRAAADAITFRAVRRELFPESFDLERTLEMHEGLADYTGWKLAGLPDNQLSERLRDRLKAAEDLESFVRSFAYYTGPVYGLLLDEYHPDWRLALTAEDNLPELLRSAMKIRPIRRPEQTAKRRLARYDGGSLRERELVREQALQQMLADYRARLVDGPVMVLPMIDFSISWNPSKQQPLGVEGTVYPNLTLAAPWGVLTVTEGGALVAGDWSQTRIPATFERDGNRLEGAGWVLDLATGWGVASGEREGDYGVKRE